MGNDRVDEEIGRWLRHVSLEGVTKQITVEISMRKQMGDMRSTMVIHPKRCAVIPSCVRAEIPSAFGG